MVKENFKKSFSLIVSLFCFVAPVAPLLEEGVGFITHLNCLGPWITGAIMLLTYWLKIKPASIIQIALTIGTAGISMYSKYDNAYLILIGLVALNLLRVYDYLKTYRTIKMVLITGLTLSLWLIAAVVQTQNSSIYTPIQFILFMTMTTLVLYITHKHDKKCIQDELNKIQILKNQLKDKYKQYEAKHIRQAEITSEIKETNKLIKDVLKTLENSGESNGRTGE